MAIKIVVTSGNGVFTYVDPDTGETFEAEVADILPESNSLSFTVSELMEYRPVIENDERKHYQQLARNRLNKADRHAMHLPKRRRR